jgi:hypothetical protein
MSLKRRGPNGTPQLGKFHPARRTSPNPSNDAETVTSNTPSSLRTDTVTTCVDCERVRCTEVFFKNKAKGSSSNGALIQVTNEKQSTWESVRGRRLMPAP